MNVCKSLTVSDLNDMVDQISNKKVDLNANFFYQLAASNPQLDKQDFIGFLQQCLLNGADPRRKQVYLIPRTSKGETKGTTVFAYQFFIAKAQATGLLDGFDVETIKEDYTHPQTGKTMKSLTSIAKVYRKDQSHPVIYKARFWEFAGKKYDGSLTMIWKEKPYLMIEKCAIANAMRLAFPDDLSGMYTQEEMSHVQGTPIIVDTKPPAVETNSKWYDETINLLKKLSDNNGDRRKFILSEINGDIDWKHNKADTMYWCKAFEVVDKIRVEDVDAVVDANLGK